MREDDWRNPTRSRLATRILVFSIGPGLSLLAPLISLPIITSHFGAPGWASIALGISLGGFSAVVSEIGWSITGPIAMARAAPTERRSLILESLVQRGILLFLSTPLIALVVLNVNVDFLPAFISGCSSALMALSPAWAFIGLGRAKELLIVDSIPRTLSTIIGASLLLLGAPLTTLPAVQGLVAILIALVPLRMFRDDARRRLSTVVAGAIRDMRQQTAALTTRVATSAYVALPTTLVAILGASTAQLANYSGVERIARTGLTALQPFGQAFQGWIPAASQRSGLLRRMRAALLVNLGVAALGSLSFFVLIPFALDLLFRGSLDMNIVMRASFSVVIFSVVLSRCTGIQCLAPLGKMRVVAISTVAGGIVGVPMFVVGYWWLGVSGVAVVVAGVEFLVLIIQLWVLLPVLLRRVAGEE